MSFPYTVQGLPDGDPPLCLARVEHLVLEQGICSRRGQWDDLAGELAAATCLAWHLPKVSRVDLSKYNVSVLLPQRRKPLNSVVSTNYLISPAPLLPNCFAVPPDIQVHDASGGSSSSSRPPRASQDLLTWTSTWAWMLKRSTQAFVQKGAGVRAMRLLAMNVVRARGEACRAAAGDATAFIAHALDQRDDLKGLLEDLKLLPNLRELTLVLWAPPESPHRSARAAGSRRPGELVDTVVSTSGPSSEAGDIARVLQRTCNGLQRLEQIRPSDPPQGPPSRLVQPQQPARPQEPPPAQLPRQPGASPPGAGSKRSTSAGAVQSSSSLPKGMRLAGFGVPEAVWSYVRHNS